MLLTMQLVALVGAIFVFGGYVLGRGKIPQDWWPRSTKMAMTLIGKPLAAGATFLVLFDMLRIFVLWRSGNLDRGFAGEETINQAVGFWTFLVLFGRCNNLWFFLLPFLWRRADTLGKVLLSACLLF